jgi:hypothetical protein
MRLSATIGAIHQATAVTKFSPDQWCQTSLFLPRLVADGQQPSPSAFCTIPVLIPLGHTPLGLSSILILLEHPDDWKEWVLGVKYGSCPESCTVLAPQCQHTGAWWTTEEIGVRDKHTRRRHADCGVSLHAKVLGMRLLDVE